MIDRIRELYYYRELIRNLVIRDLKVRYKNSVLGILWSLLNPLLMTIVFTVVFTLMLRSDIPDYPVFFMCAYLPWSFLSDTVVGGTNSIVGNSHLIKKVYFPREVLPLSDVLSGLVNFLLALVVLFGM
ncbi:MAG: ABC transporter permease, partial [Anaerolineae bacterium]